MENLSPFLVILLRHNIKIPITVIVAIVDLQTIFNTARNMYTYLVFVLKCTRFLLGISLNIQLKNLTAVMLSGFLEDAAKSALSEDYVLLSVTQHQRLNLPSDFQEILYRSSFKELSNKPKFRENRLSKRHALLRE
jgi:hypothetical protein